MASQIEIANMALDVIGTRSTIASLTEGSAEANAISRQWNNALDAVLRSAHWNFARKQIPLPLLQDGTNGGTPQVPWLYEYAYPNDCLLMRYLMAPLPSGAPGTPSIEFLMSSDFDSNGNPMSVVLTNQPQAIGVYTFRNTNTEMYDPLFVQCFAAYLGSRVAIPLTGDKNMMKMAAQEASQYAVDAQRVNGNEGITVIDIMPESIRVRGYLSDWNGGVFANSPQSLTMVS